MSRERGLTSCAWGAVVFSAMVGCGGTGTAPTAAPLLTPVTIVENTAGTTATSFNVPGQSFTVPAAYDTLRFNWIGGPGSVAGPIAFGTAYLLSMEYLGPADQLSASTPGFVAAILSIDGGQYVFSPTVRVEAGRRYWIYADTLSDCCWLTSFAHDVYPGGDGYLCCTGPPYVFHKLVSDSSGTVDDVDFRLVGIAK